MGMRILDSSLVEYTSIWEFMGSVCTVQEVHL